MAWGLELSSGFRAYGLRFRVYGLGLKVQRRGVRVVLFRAMGFEFRV